jgi:hypothetical protein
MSFRKPKPMRNVDGPSLIFIAFYVSTLTHLKSTETLLHLSENIALFTVCHKYAGVISIET